MEHTHNLKTSFIAKSKFRAIWPGLLLILVGLALVVYPFLPSWQYRLAQPQPQLPYVSKLPASTLNQVAAAGNHLPNIGTKPIPTTNRLVIPTIGVDMLIVDGPDERALDRGIWHIPNTSNPVDGGNVVLSGHRWRYLPPSNATLYLLDKVKDGELVILYWGGQEYDYRINRREVVNPNRVDILQNTPAPRLTIFTCTPLFSTKQRLVLYGELIS